MIDPMMTVRGPLPMIRGRMPPIMMGHPRPPFAPRFIPPEQFRPNMPLNQSNFYFSSSFLLLMKN